MQAALPMYAPPRAAIEAFWRALADLLRADAACAGLDIPASLSWADDIHAQWMQPDLLLSQACGYPLTTLLKGRVQLVGTFGYTAAGVEGIFCRSQLIGRSTDTRQTLEAFAGSTLAFNDTISQSGYNALRTLVASSTMQRPFFAHTLNTGAHNASIEAVRTGHADMAAIDPVSWAHWQTANPQLCAQVRVFGQTAPYPGLPLITALQTPPETVAALRRALLALASDSRYAPVRAPLLINGFVASTLEDYQVCIAMEEQAAQRGLHRL